jgi:glycosyltransferase involved in cell wall biosynthesis
MLVARSGSAAPVVTIHNWADNEPRPPGPPEPLVPGRFVIVYGGNLGRAQGLETVLEAAARLQSRRPKVLIRVYGDGVEAVRLGAYAQQLGLSNLEIHCRIGKAEINAIFARADALLVHLADHPLFTITLPQKIQAYMASGRPIGAGLAGEAARLLRASDGALVVPPGDPTALCEALATLADTPSDDLLQMGLRGRAYYHRNLSFQRGVQQTLRVLEGARTAS